MRFVEAAGFTADHQWGAQDLLALYTATVRLHWTDAPYRCHVNDGPDVFVVLDGAGGGLFNCRVVLHVRRVGVRRGGLGGGIAHGSLLRWTRVMLLFTKVTTTSINWNVDSV